MTPVQVFSSEFWEIFRNTFLIEHHRPTASEFDSHFENLSAELSNKWYIVYIHYNYSYNRDN